jgi:hypothetical protein
MTSEQMDKLNQELRVVANKSGKHIAALKDKHGNIFRVFISGLPIGGVLPFIDHQKYPDCQLLAWAFPWKKGCNKVNPESGKVYRSDTDWRKDYEKFMPNIGQIQKRIMEETKRELPFLNKINPSQK